MCFSHSFWLLTCQIYPGRSGGESLELFVAQIGGVSGVNEEN